MRSGFTDDDLNRPIFIDPPEGIERDDGWSTPHGFMLGGMGDPTKPEIAQQYFDAAEALVTVINAQQVEDYTIAHLRHLIRRLPEKLSQIQGVTKPAMDFQ